MTHEINLGGAIYISSKQAAEISGYAQDYIGQLARSGQIEARRVSGLWYILEDSLLKHKEKADDFVPQPPPPSDQGDMESSISFDGRDFVSASRAAEITGYSQDYVAQLARGGKVEGHQIGNRWYVDRGGLQSHKREKDALLAAVQAESVGLHRFERETETVAAPSPSSVTEEMLTYTKDTADLLPVFPEKPAGDDIRDKPETPVATDHPVIESQPEERIPIRVITERPKKVEAEETQSFTAGARDIAYAPKVTMLIVVIFGLISALAGAFLYMQGERSDLEGTVLSRSFESSSLASSDSAVTRTIDLIFSGALSKELHYRR